MRRKREYNKNHPEEHEARRSEHKKQRKKRLNAYERRRLKRLKKERIRQVKRDYRMGLLSDLRFKQEMEKINGKTKELAAG